MNILPILIAIGTYTSNTASEGIYIMELDLENQQYHIIQTIAAQNPSYLQYLNKKSTLYYVEEVGAGTVNAVQLDNTNWAVEQTYTFKTEGSSPCHIAISPDEKTLIASNYSSGNFTTFSLKENGIIEQHLSSYQFESNSVNPTRQKQSHVHSAFYTNDGKKVFIQDLGGDHIYQFDAEAIRKNNSPFITHKMPEGSGPRHLTFSSDKKFVYIINELNGTIDTYSLNKEGEIKAHIQNITTDNTEGDNLCAHIRLSPDGKYVYASNRGEKNSISVFAVQRNGTLLHIQTIGAEGKGPRHFEFTPDGKWIIVANQLSNNISLFARDEKSGLLSFSNLKVDIPAPVCITVL